MRRSSRGRSWSSTEDGSWCRAGVSAVRFAARAAGRAPVGGASHRGRHAGMHAEQLTQASQVQHPCHRPGRGGQQHLAARLPACCRALASARKAAQSMNSRACRSTITQCSRPGSRPAMAAMVAAASRCQLPVQCHHDVTAAYPGPKLNAISMTARLPAGQSRAGSGPGGWLSGPSPHTKPGRDAGPAPDDERPGDRSIPVFSTVSTTWRQPRSQYSRVVRQ